MMMKSVYSCWKWNKIEDKEAVAFCHKWAEAMELRIPEIRTKSDIEETIKSFAYPTSAEASTDLFIRARNLLVEHWLYGDILAKYT